MVSERDDPRLAAPKPVVNFPTATAAPQRGLLIAADPALVRAFRRELRGCTEEGDCVDVEPTIEQARAAGREGYGWVAVDLDGARAPADAVRLAREGWPDTRLAVLSHFWSERDTIARGLADLVIHKPPRAQELRALFLPWPAPREEPDAPRTASSG